MSDSLPVRCGQPQCGGNANIVRLEAEDYSIGEWTAALISASFAIMSCRTWRLRMDFPVWTARMRTPADHIKAIRALQEAASAETKAHFAIEDDGSFLLDILMIEAVGA